MGRGSDVLAVSVAQIPKVGLTHYFVTIGIREGCKIQVLFLGAIVVL